MAEENNSITTSSDITASLASLLKTFSQNSVDVSDIDLFMNNGEQSNESVATVCDANKSFIEEENLSRTRGVYNMPTMKALENHKNGQIYLLVKGNNVNESVDSSKCFSHNFQLLTKNEPDTCSNMLNNQSIIMTTQQFHLSDNLSTAQLIEKLFESSSQTSCSYDCQQQSTNGDHKLIKATLPSISSSYGDLTGQSDYCDEPDVTLSFENDNPRLNSQFVLAHGQSSHENPGTIKLELNPTKFHCTNYLPTHGLETRSTDSTAMAKLSSLNSTCNNGLSHRRNLKRIKSKPLKNTEDIALAQCGSKANSPIFSTSQPDNASSKGSDHGEVKEPIKKSSHNEVERRRRDKINTWIGELQNMLPNSEKMQLNRSKSHVLKAVYDHFRIQTDQFNDYKIKNKKLDIDNREKIAIIKKLELEKKVLLGQLQYINQAVTSTVKSTQESLSRSTINQYRITPINAVKVTEPSTISNMYNGNFDNGYDIDGSQHKKKKSI